MKRLIRGYSKFLIYIIRYKGFSDGLRETLSIIRKYYINKIKVKKIKYYLRPITIPAGSTSFII